MANETVSSDRKLQGGGMNALCANPPRCTVGGPYGANAVSSVEQGASSYLSFFVDVPGLGRLDVSTNILTDRAFFARYFHSWANPFAFAVEDAPVYRQRLALSAFNEADRFCSYCKSMGGEYWDLYLRYLEEINGFYFSGI